MLTVLIEADDKESFEFALEKGINDGHIPIWETFRVTTVIDSSDMTIISYYIILKKETN